MKPHLTLLRPTPNNKNRDPFFFSKPNYIFCAKEKLKKRLSPKKRGATQIENLKDQNVMKKHFRHQNKIHL